MPSFATILPKLHQLSINDLDISLSEVELLTHGLGNSTQLHTLRLARCRLNDEHMSVLSPNLGNHPSIKFVDFTSNRIGDAGMTSFADHWKPASSIEKLILSWNDIGAKGVEHLVKDLSTHPTLNTLSLGFNFSIGFDGLKLIGKAISNTKIQILNLDNAVRWIDYRGVATCDTAVIQEAKRTAASKALLEGVRGNSHLLQLSCDYDVLLPHVTKEIDLYLEANECGRGQALELQHSLPTAIWCHFLAKDRITASLNFLFLREMPNLMQSCGSSKSKNNNNNNKHIGQKRCRNF